MVYPSKLETQTNIVFFQRMKLFTASLFDSLTTFNSMAYYIITCYNDI